MSVPLPVVGLDLRDQDTLTLLAMCLWGEARNQTEEGLIAVGCVIRNRVLSGRFGASWKDVMLAPKQFSCFNPDDPNRRKMMEPDRYGTPGVWARVARVAEGIFRGETKDITDGSDHYHTVQRPKGAKVWPPSWARRMTKTLVAGDHVFYRSAR